MFFRDVGSAPSLSVARSLCSFRSTLTHCLQRVDGRVCVWWRREEGRRGGGGEGGGRVVEGEGREGGREGEGEEEEVVVVVQTVCI